MSDSVRLLILKQIVQRLNTLRPSNVPEFELLRTIPTEADAHPGASVYPAREPSDPVSNRASKATVRTLRAIVEMRFAAKDPLIVSDPATQWITSRLGGVRLSTPEYPQLSQEILERDTQWKIAQRQVPFLAVFVELEVPYTTKVHDQTAQPS